MQKDTTFDFQKVRKTMELLGKNGLPSAAFIYARSFQFFPEPPEISYTDYSLSIQEEMACEEVQELMQNRFGIKQKNDGGTVCIGGYKQNLLMTDEIVVGVGEYLELLATVADELSYVTRLHYESVLDFICTNAMQPAARALSEFRKMNSN